MQLGPGALRWREGILYDSLRVQAILANRAGAGAAADAPPGPAPPASTALT
jgi:hypothetical protein